MLFLCGRLKMSDVDRIANIIHNYADGKFGELDNNHVERWLSQFDNQDIVAFETANLLEKYYFSKQCFNVFIDNIHYYLYNNLSLNNDIYILNLQDNNKSQFYLNNMLFEKYGNNYGCNYPIGDFVYIDDFLFSGHTLKNTLSKFLEVMKRYILSNSILYILCINYNEYYINRTIEELVKKYTIHINIIPFFSRFDLALNECLQPTQETISNNIISAYTNDSLSQIHYKPRVRTNSDFMSEKNRVIYEEEMIKAGIKIINFCQHPHPVMKPLGYGWYGYGAGFTAFTQRNCPNTTPLAFWWGDPNSSSNHPFSKWYPLMQRIV